MPPRLRRIKHRMKRLKTQMRTLTSFQPTRCWIVIEVSDERCQAQTCCLFRDKDAAELAMYMLADEKLQYAS